MARGPQFQPVQPVRAYQRIVEQVEDALARGDLAPGQRLPSERELVTQFAVSRSTVREALRVLESNGVVRSRPGDPTARNCCRTPTAPCANSWSGWPGWTTSPSAS